MANEDRLAALGKRVHREEEKPMSATTISQSKKSKVQSRRGRHTFYLDKTTVDQLDQAFKDAAHELYPHEIEKADYLEACLAFALAHQEEIKTALAHSPQG
jgi:hypothetical protein